MLLTAVVTVVAIAVCCDCCCYLLDGWLVDRVSGWYCCRFDGVVTIVNHRFSCCNPCCVAVACTLLMLAVAVAVAVTVAGITKSP